MGLVWQELAPVSRASLQSTGTVQGGEGCAGHNCCPPAVNPFLHICGEKETPTWNKFPGKNSVLVPRVTSWLFFFSPCSFSLIWVSSLPLIFWVGVWVLPGAEHCSSSRWIQTHSGMGYVILPAAV